MELAFRTCQLCALRHGSTRVEATSCVFTTGFQHYNTAETPGSDVLLLVTTIFLQAPYALTL
eukprot:89352-Amphidinium_carterae.1